MTDPMTPETADLLAGIRNWVEIENRDEVLLVRVDDSADFAFAAGDFLF